MMLPHLFIKLANVGFGGGRGLGPAELRAKSLWNIAGDAGVEVGMVGWRNTWPAEKVRGFMVSRQLHQESPQSHTFPPELETTVRSVLDSLPGPSIDAIVTCRDQDILKDHRVKDRIRRLKGCLADDLRYQALAQRLFPVSRPRLMGLGFLSNDCIGHAFYYEHALHHHPDRYPMDSHLSRFTSPAIVGGLGSVIDNAYVYHDSLFGLWTEWLGPEAALMIVSDHGFEMDGSNHYYGPPGILILYGHPFRKDTEIAGATILDIAPTALHLLGLPVPQDMEGRVLTEALDPEWLASNPVRTTPTYEPRR
jgi:predicted AlkP superfamily phosphohydrolase/phosphomutase